MAEENKPTATNNLEVKFDFPKVNLAMQQNKKSASSERCLSATRAKKIKSIHHHHARHSVCRRHSIDSGKPARRQTINAMSGLDLVPDANYVLQLTERVNANLQLKISAGDQPLFCQQYPISILTFSEWTGTKIEPALTAAFVTPNHPPSFLL